MLSIGIDTGEKLRGKKVLAEEKSSAGFMPWK